jgi:hypothetical protein
MKIVIAVLILSIAFASLSLAAPERLNFDVKISSASSTVTYNNLDPNEFAPKEKGNDTPAPVPPTVIPVNRFSVSIQNNEEFRIKCDVTFSGYQGSILGYKLASEDISTLVAAGDVSRMDQPSEILLLDASSISVHCMKFSIP